MAVHELALAVSDPLTHPAARWLLDQLDATVGPETIGDGGRCRVYGMTFIDLAGAPGDPVARSSFVAERELHEVVDVEHHRWSACFDAVAVVRWVDGRATVARLFVNP